MGGWVKGWMDEWVGGWDERVGDVSPTIVCFHEHKHRQI